MTTFIDQASAEAETLASMPTHAEGDLLIAFTGRFSSNANYTVPSGWDQRSVSTAGGMRSFVHTRQAASASESFGVFTNTELVSCLVYRPATNRIVVPATNVLAVTSSTDVVYPSVSIVVDPSWVIELALLSLNGTNIATANTATLRMSRTGASGGHLVVHDTNADQAVGATGNKTVAITGGPVARHAHRIQLYDLPGFRHAGAAFPPFGNQGVFY